MKVIDEMRKQRQESDQLKIQKIQRYILENTMNISIDAPEATPAQQVCIAGLVSTTRRDLFIEESSVFDGDLIVWSNDTGDGSHAYISASGELEIQP